MKKVLLYFMLVLICVNIILSGCTANYKTEESTQDQTEPVAEEPTINVNDILTNINSKKYTEATNTISRMSDNQLKENKEEIFTAVKESISNNQLKLFSKTSSLISMSNSDIQKWTNLKGLCNTLEKRTGDTFGKYKTYVEDVIEFENNYSQYYEFIDYYNSTECQFYLDLTTTTDFSYSGVLSTLALFTDSDLTQLQEKAAQDTNINDLYQALLEYMTALGKMGEGMYENINEEQRHEGLAELQSAMTKLNNINIYEGELEQNILEDYGLMLLD